MPIMYRLRAITICVVLAGASTVMISAGKGDATKGKAIQDTGITPNQVVADVDAAIEVDDNGEPLPDTTPDKGTQKHVEDDPIVKKAIEVLAKMS